MQRYTWALWALFLAPALSLADPKLSKEEEAFFTHKPLTKEFSDARSNLLASINTQMKVNLLSEADAYAEQAAHTKAFGSLLLMAKTKTPKLLLERDQATGSELAVRIVEKAAVLFSFSQSHPIEPLSNDEYESMTELVAAILEGFPTETINDSLLKVLQTAEAMIATTRSYTGIDNHPIIRKANERALHFLRSDRENMLTEKEKFLPPDQRPKGKKIGVWARYQAIGDALKAVAKLATPSGKYGEKEKVFLKAQKPQKWAEGQGHYLISLSKFSEMDQETRALVLQVSHDGRPHLASVVAHSGEIKAENLLKDMKEESAMTYRPGLSNDGWVFQRDEITNRGRNRSSGKRHELIVRVASDGKLVIMHKLYDLQQGKSDDRSWERVELKEIELGVTAK